MCEGLFMDTTETKEAFREAEASLRLEGMDPSGEIYYESLKARVIAGEITFAQGEAELLAHHRQQAHARAVA